MPAEEPCRAIVIARAFRDAVEYFRAHPDEALDLLSDRAKHRTSLLGETHPCRSHEGSTETGTKHG